MRFYRYIVILLIGALLLVIPCLGWYLRSANATNAAFPYTKHGGGTVDGVSFSGVDRGVNPDYGANYNSINPEAGKYKPGECAHCHEAHASFGGSEPPPASGSAADPGGGPNPYLEMADSNPGSCWYCHENINYDPLYVGGTGSWRFYQGKGIYQGSSHYTSPNFYWPGTSGDPVAIWPRMSRAGAPSGNSGHCLNCHTPHGIKETPGKEFDTTAVPTSPANLHLAANNPSVSTDYLIPRQLIAWEEALCNNCHDSNGPSTKNIRDEIYKRSIGGSGHPVDDTTLAGRHVASETLPITSKHVECDDCHNPHAAKAPTGFLGDGDGGSVKGMKYVDINGTVQSPTIRQPYIYEICFKCHGNSFDCIMPYKALGASDGTAGCTPLTATSRGNDAVTQLGASNKRVEFNPNTIIGASHGADNTKTNGSFHPVASAGLNNSSQLCKQLASAFGLTCVTPAIDLNLTINCTDCHNNNITGGVTVRGPVSKSNLRLTDKNSVTSLSPVGPHGSTSPRILRANYNTTIGAGTSNGNGTGIGDAAAIAAMDNNFALCFRCHDSTPFKTSADNTWTNFYSSTKGNLHYLHLSQTMSDAVYIKCHECHNNVHSNVEANNTQYYSVSMASFASDNKTHLINFGPQATFKNYPKPAWYDAGGGKFSCDLVCHNRNENNTQY